jgi:hypothetical protein
VVSTSATSAVPSSSAAVGGKSATIVYVSPDDPGRHEVEQAIFADFTKANPSIAVQVTSGGASWTMEQQKLTASIAGRIDFAGDRDVFRFVAPASGRMVIDLSSVGNKLDTILSVVNGLTRQIARNDNARIRVKDSQVVLNVVSGRTYYLVVSAKGGRTGTYSLSAHFTGRIRAVPKRTSSVKKSAAAKTHVAAHPLHPRAWTKQKSSTTLSLRGS